MSPRGVALFVGGGLANAVICFGLRGTIGERILHLGPPADTLWKLPASRLYAWMALANLPIWLWMCALSVVLLRRWQQGSGRIFVWTWIFLCVGWCSLIFLMDVSCLPLPPEVGFNTCGL